MPTQIITAHDFDNDVTTARKSAQEGPIIIMDWGNPKHVLMSYDDWKRLIRFKRSNTAALSEAEAAEIEFKLRQFEHRETAPGYAP